MPLSLIGAFFIMLVLGYTINLLTLLALVLAIGLVVDDAIIVVENVHRHMEGGMKPLPAAIQGARELAGPIIAISVVLIAVYVPIGFMGGLTGALFTEFAYTLAGAVAVSAVIALTLSPMMCSRFLKPTGHGGQKGFAAFIDRQFTDLRARLRAPAARLAQYPRGHGRVRRDHPREHLFPLRELEERAGAAGGPGDHHRPDHGRA